VIYDRTYHVSLVTGAAGRRSGIPYVNTIVENPEVGFYSTAGPLGRLKYYQLRRVYRRAAQVVCVSRGLVSASAKFFGLPESMFACCYNFVDQRRMRTIEVARQHRPPCPPPTLIPPLGTAERPLKIIGVGRLHWQKGLDNLLRATATLVQQHRLAVELALVGDGPERQALQTLAAELGLAQQVRFEGWKPDPSQDVAHSDLFALPSLAEGLPNSLLEALLIGTPAIAADCRFGPAELAEDGKWATLLPGHNPTVWAAAIARFAASPWADIDRACRARAVLERRFDASQGCAQLQAILQRAAGGVAKDA
jgi:glycosyltransferase involved in cell wall biosynthesis